MTPNESPSSESDLNMIYIQARADVISGELSCTEEDAIYFAGLHCQVTFGDHKADHHVLGFLTRTLHDYVPVPLFKQNDPRRWEEAIFEQHAKLKGKSASDCMRDFLTKCRTFSSYGHILYETKFMACFLTTRTGKLSYGSDAIFGLNNLLMT
ncbi:hypothetical protein RCL1_002384 [Eukaryota sp. TZLM3-RCL]